ncbi:glycosyltransferase [Sorangium sp. So ce1014]|uniref:glycosyltransferase n=1 Tax=Sorangium sp. So ce1014 TaxID=3133326 RepID=UPI003F62779B
MRRALLVSYYFPPRFSVGGKRAYRFAKFLPEHGWAATVLTARPPPGERLDTSFAEADLLPACDVRRDYLTDAELARMPRRALGSDGTVEAPTEAPRQVARQRGLARVAAELRYVPVIGPDAGRIPALAARIGRLAREVGAEVIFASGAPWATVLAGVLAGRAIGRPVVADFRDPWSFGPMRGMRPAWVRAAVALVERAAVGAAAAFTVTSEMTRDAYAARGIARRVASIRTGFDPDAAVAPRRDGAVTLVHFGNCYGERTLAPFVRALAAVARRRSLGPGAIRLLNLGRVAKSDLLLAEELGVSRLIEHRTVLPYAEGLGLVAGADLALLIGFGDEPYLLPGKLYDYLLARAPILAVSPSPEVARILEATRLGWTHAAGDAAAIERRVEDAVDARAAGRPLVEPDDEALSGLSARATAGALARLFEDVTARGGG